MPIRRDPAHVFFPWERRRGLRSVVGRARSRKVLAAVAVAAVFAMLHGVEQDQASLRVTRNAITIAIRAVHAWRADHDRHCPGALSDLVAAGYVSELPRDAWGRPLRLTCPGRQNPQEFDVSSDGPDGVPGGLDRVE